ncbi:phosphocarrier protein HPr [Haloactinospora alba]|uniref:Phosphocarrier protein HPr n=1 Tax=Haloactinospora alba TaxID=405555 RepID=A0A543NKD5_9ACTN|nr:HPr family phosphocarrier protein [Haloactinospora alba]TQN32250.1 phosphocarrier protein HPr [Haloactinospora alba]
MATATATIGSPVGLHARPAALFVEAASSTGLAVTITKDGSAPADARSLLMVMGVGAKHGDTVTLHADGENADTHLAELVELLERETE